MGSSPLVGPGKDVGNGGGASGVGGAGGCCAMSMKCGCRWWWCEKDYYRALSWLNNGVVFLLGCLAVFGSIGMVYAWLAFTPVSGRGGGVGGCEEDSEGSWSIGVFYGDSPFSLRPIEDVNVLHERHWDLLVLCTIPRDDTGEYYCEICVGERNPDLWAYYCLPCEYEAHTSCVNPCIMPCDSNLLEPENWDQEVGNEKIFSWEWLRHMSDGRNPLLPEIPRFKRSWKLVNGQEETESEPK